MLLPLVAPGRLSEKSRVTPLRIASEWSGCDGESKGVPKTIGFGSGAKVAANDGGSVAVEDVGVRVAVEAGGGLDGGAAIAGLAEGLGVYAGDFDADLKPVANLSSRLRRGRL
jgi:hypothetical protein